MPKSPLLFCAVLLLALAVPALAYAQFQQPTDEELKMTTDPKAPGADAVYLEVRDITNDNLHVHSYYARIKVLTDKGKKLATVELPYVNQVFTISDIKGRTIHPDGSVVPLDVKPEDLLSEKSGELQFKRKVFTLPSVEVGSILEYSYAIRSDGLFDPPDWDVQKPYFVHKAHYEFQAFEAFALASQTSRYLVDGDGDTLNLVVYSGRLPAGVAVHQSTANALFTLDVTDVPAAPDEEWMPPLDSILYGVNFYYKDGEAAGQWWQEAGKRWVKRVNRFADPSKPIQDAVAKIVAPGDTEIEKAQKLYAAVQALDNTDFSRVKTESERKELQLKVQKRAEDTWAQKSGSGLDIAYLYLAMLRAAGLKAYALQLVDRSQWIFEPSYMTLRQFTDGAVILKIGDKETFLDPGEKMCPFGTLAWEHEASAGIREEDQGAGITTTPYSSYTANSILRTGDLTVDPQGGVTGTLQIIMTGEEALRWRQVALRNDADEMKKQFDHELEGAVPDGVTAHVDHFLGMDTPDSNLMAVVKVQGTLGIATSKRLLLPGNFLESRSQTPFVKEEKREVAVDMHYGDRVTDQITYHLPSGFSIEGAPPTADISWQGHARYVSNSKADPGQLIVSRSFARAFTFAKPEEYQDLRGFYQKVAAADQAQLVLTSAPAANAAPGTTASPVVTVAPAGKGN